MKPEATEEKFHTKLEEGGNFQRRFAQGVEIVPNAGVHFRIWAPRSNTVFVQLGKTACDVECGSWVVELIAESDGYFSAHIPEAHAGLVYKYRLDGGVFPDPASRFQPDGPHGASQIFDPNQFQWTDKDWKGLAREGQVIYEMHIGTFTKSGTWREAIDQFDELKKIGITVLEIMPVGDFPGEFGWGYDGVNLFAPTRLYGSPDDFRFFVDRAHAIGLGIVLDVVYNHFGPDGNYISQFSRDYFNERYENEWGDAINFDGKNSKAVREFFISNAAYWIEEFHLDGLRLDATQAIYDSSDKKILAEITSQIRASAHGRGTLIIAENEPQHARLVRALEKNGFGMDALWNDDFHHSAMVALTGRREAYYMDYKGSPQEFISALKRGFLFQGQRYKWQEVSRGTPALDLEPSNFIHYVQNHDQVANSLHGLRAHQESSPGAFRAMTAMLLLGPQTPMLFQGQEFGASSPFLFFAGHEPELAGFVREGRKKFLSQFPGIASLGAAAHFADPSEKMTFQCCKLDFSERKKNFGIYELHCDLLKIRHGDPVFSKSQRGGIDGAVLSSQAFVIRFFGKENNDYLLVVNLGVELNLDPAPEPLLAPPENCVWKLKWSSEDPRYGGCGAPSLETEQNWKIPGLAAVLLNAHAATDIWRDDSEP